jgi:hypothetical protein
MCTCPLTRGTRSTSHSTAIPTRRRCHCRCRRRSGALGTLAALGTLSTSAVATADARPLPISIHFLDFLYPSWFTPPPSPVQAPAIATTSDAKRATPAAKRARKVPKRNLPAGLQVPVKFESADIGWIVAESWDLHGRHRRADVRILFLPFPPFYSDFWHHFTYAIAVSILGHARACSRIAGNRFLVLFLFCLLLCSHPLFLNPPSSL